MSEEIDAMMEVYYDGENRAVSMGGYVVRCIVPFEDMDKFRAMAEGSWNPDNPVSFVLTRVLVPTKRFDPKTKEWIIPDEAP